jgi:hypothetical protein
MEMSELKTDDEVRMIPFMDRSEAVYALVAEIIAMRQRIAELEKALMSAEAAPRTAR